MNREKTPLYICDPEKNKGCAKGSCFLHGGPCCLTANKEYEALKIDFNAELEAIRREPDETIKMAKIMRLAFATSDSDKLDLIYHAAGIFRYKEDDYLEQLIHGTPSRSEQPVGLCRHSGADVHLPSQIREQVDLGTLFGEGFRKGLETEPAAFHRTAAKLASQAIAAMETQKK